MDENLFIGYLDFGKGIIKIQSDNEYITNIDFVDKIGNEIPNKVILRCKEELQEYFDGIRTEFSIKTRFNIGTDFQKKVWNELKSVEYGKTVTYKDMATKIGNDKASRAIGGANNKNPISIIFP